VGAGADQARDPVHRAQLVENRAADARGAVGFELDAALQVEGVDGVHQAEDAGGHQVVQLDLIGQLDVDPLGVVAHQMEIILHQDVAQRFGLVFLYSIQTSLMSSVVSCQLSVAMKQLTTDH
jgi:hypothetical protein